MASYYNGLHKHIHTYSSRWIISFWFALLFIRSFTFSSYLTYIVLIYYITYNFIPLTLDALYKNIVSYNFILYISFILQRNKNDIAAFFRKQNSQYC